MDPHGDSLRALLQLHEALGDVDASFEQVLELAVQGIARLVGDAAALWLDGPAGVQLRAFDHRHPRGRAYMAELFGSTGWSDGLVAHTVSEGQSLRADSDAIRDLTPSMTPAFRQYYDKHGAGGLLLVPLATSQRRVGAIGVSRDPGGPPFDDQELAYLRQIARIVSLAVANAQLVEAAEASERRAQAVAREDELTGLLNRRGFLEAVRAALAERPGQPALLVALDLDGFKHVNDGFGRAAGDQVLNSVAKRLCDVIPASTIVARLGGDEFALLVQADDDEGAAAVVERVVQACTTTVQVVALSVPVTVSVGTVAVGDDGEDALLQHAYLAKYRAKRHAGSYVAMYDARQDGPATRRLRDVMELRTALRSGDVIVYYQPVVDLHGGPLRVEALVRLRRGDRVLLPEAFLRLADQAGLMPELTHVVLDTVVAQLTIWWRNGLPIECAVNVPAQVLAMSDLLPSLLSRLEEAGLPRQALSVEVTENDLVGPNARAALVRCAAAGISVAVDDFGTGYSALSYLVELPLRVLKIDRSFVEGVEIDTRRAAVVRALVTCAHDLDLRVVAEGVETAAASEAMVRLGADALQGYHFGHPMSAQDLTAHLSRRVTVLRP